MIFEFNPLSITLLVLGVVLAASAIWDVLESATANNQVLDVVFGRSSRVVLSVLAILVGLALSLDLSWMQWTSSTAVFFIGLFSLLVIMTLWDKVSPTTHPKGFLPIGFSRGERLFLSFMIFFGTMFFWGAFLPDVSLWFGIGTAAVLIVIVDKFG